MSNYKLQEIHSSRTISKEVRETIKGFSEDTDYNTIKKFFWDNLRNMAESYLYSGTNECFTMINENNLDRDFRFNYKVIQVFKDMNRYSLLSDINVLYLNFIYHGVFKVKENISKKKLDMIYDLFYEINNTISHDLSKIFRREKDELAIELSVEYNYCKFAALTAEKHVDYYKMLLIKVINILRAYKLKDVQTIIDVLTLLFKDHIETLIYYILTAKLWCLSGEYETYNAISTAVLEIINSLDLQELKLNLAIIFVLTPVEEIYFNIYDIPEEYENIHKLKEDDNLSEIVKKTSTKGREN